MKRWSILVALGSASAVAACASILGIEDGTLEPSLGDGGEGGVQICVSDSGVQPDQNQVFVSHDLGVDGDSCGALEAPCKTLGAAIATLPKTRGANIIYIADGTYPETVNLPANVEIQGGWHARPDGASNLQWSQICPDALTSPDQLANIVGSENITIHVDSVAGAKLSHVVIKTKTAAQGESLYGIFASGPTTTLALNGVIVLVNQGGDGPPGASGIAGGPGTGACTVGNPVTPAPGKNGDPAPAATFGASGVAAEAAGPGLSGTTGGSGIAGTAGACISCLTCAGGLGACASAPSSCGLVGSSGCGGQGGTGGGPGRNGGSSIGIYTWGGAVIAVGGQIKSGNGGNGGAGGVGGSGGEGGVGPKGDPGPTCNTSCVNAGIACTAVSSGTGAGTGGNGTLGAAGSSGGTGGGGVGGFSYAIVSGLDASVSVDGGAMLDHGSGGSNGGGASSAQSGDRYP